MPTFNAAPAPPPQLLALQYAFDELREQLCASAPKIKQAARRLLDAVYDVPAWKQEWERRAGLILQKCEELDYVNLRERALTSYQGTPSTERDRRLIERLRRQTAIPKTLFELDPISADVETLLGSDLLAADSLKEARRAFARWADSCRTVSAEAAKVGADGCRFLLQLYSAPPGALGEDAAAAAGVIASLRHGDTSLMAEALQAADLFVAWSALGPVASEPCESKETAANSARSDTPHRIRKRRPKFFWCKDAKKCADAFKNERRNGSTITRLDFCLWFADEHNTKPTGSTLDKKLQEHADQWDLEGEYTRKSR